jgi:hypothetical protein
MKDFGGGALKRKGRKPQEVTKVSKMVDISHWIFGSIYGFRWMFYEFGS